MPVSAKVSRGRRVGAALASLLAMAAAGSFVLGRARRGAVLIAVEMLCAFGGVTAILGGAAWGHALFASVLLVRVGAFVDALRLAPGERLPPAWAAWAMALGLWALAFGDAALTRAFAVEAFVVRSGSMMPTIADGDQLLVDKRGGALVRGDVVAFRLPSDRRHVYVKRIIAVGGERVEVRAGVLLVDGSAVETRTLAEPCSYEERDEVERANDEAACVAVEERAGDRSWRVIRDAAANAPVDVAAVVVPAGGLYLVGDNRDNSHDSRHFGPVAARDVVGRVLGIYGGIRRPFSAIRPVP